VQESPHNERKADRKHQRGTQKEGEKGKHAAGLAE